MNTIISLLLNIGFFILAFIIVFISGDKLSFYAKLLGKKKNVSDFIMGTILLSVITSLPELSSGFSAIFLAKNPNLMIADVFGSNFFNITTLWFAVLIVLILKFELSEISKSHINTILFSIIIPVSLVLFFLLPPHFRKLGVISIPSIILIALLPFAMKTFKSAAGEEAEDEVSFSKKYLNYSYTKIFSTFLFFSILIIFSGIILGKTSDFIAKFPFHLNGKEFFLGSSFVGSLFLAISTSLPEVSVTMYSIFKYKSINLAYGNILGSNLFNTLIFLLGDLFTKSPLINVLSPGNLILLVGLSISSIFFIFEKNLNKLFKIIFAIIFIAVYVVILTLIFGK
ncbi:hypothetical protein J7L48_10085 [bacterium]|nr:hypothetical protein [bacterium]